MAGKKTISFLFAGFLATTFWGGALCAESVVPTDEMMLEEQGEFDIDHLLEIEASIKNASDPSIKAFKIAKKQRDFMIKSVCGILVILAVAGCLGYYGWQLFMAERNSLRQDVTGLQAAVGLMQTTIGALQERNRLIHGYYNELRQGINEELRPAVNDMNTIIQQMNTQSAQALQTALEARGQMTEFSMRQLDKFADYAKRLEALESALAQRLQLINTK